MAAEDKDEMQMVAHTCQSTNKRRKPEKPTVNANAKMLSRPATRMVVKPLSCQYLWAAASMIAAGFLSNRGVHRLCT